MRLSTLVAPIMRDNGGGAIVNIATVGAYTGGPGVGAYGASKAALLNASKTLSKELAPWNIRVNAISPGPIKSELTEGAEKATPGFYERAALATTLKRVAETVEIVGPGALPGQRGLVVRHRGGSHRRRRHAPWLSRWRSTARSPSSPAGPAASVGPTRCSWPSGAAGWW